MGLFTKDKSLKFAKIPSAPEQKQARSYLVDLMENNLQFDPQPVADLTDTEKQIQGKLPSYLSMADSDFNSARDYYNDVLSGNYDPSKSDYYQGFRNEQDRLKKETQLGIARAGQKAGIARSTPVLGTQAKAGAQIDDQTLQQLGLLYENERTRMANAANELPQLTSRNLSNVGTIENLASIARQQEQDRLSAMYQAALQTMLAPYNYNAQIASALLNEQRYTGYETGGGMTDLYYGLKLGIDAAKVAAV